MKRNLLSLLAVLLAAVSSAFAQKVQNPKYDKVVDRLLSHSVSELTVEQADSLKKAEPNIVFIDTRERREFEVSHIKDAIWVGYSDVNLARMKDVPKDTKVIAYCSVGARSEKVAEALKANGYTDVSNLYGSIFEWVNQGLPVYNIEGVETDSVHAYNKSWGKWLESGTKVYE